MSFWTIHVVLQSSQPIVTSTAEASALRVATRTGFPTDEPQCGHATFECSSSGKGGGSSGDGTALCELRFAPHAIRIIPIRLRYCFAFRRMIV